VLEQYDAIVRGKLGDRVQLQQVALNLVLNGIDAMRESGTRDRVLVLRTARAGAKTVRAEVGVSGVGINEGDMGKIFQAFYTTKPFSFTLPIGHDGGHDRP
jgi:C4-dicarboxylate-specific signal transduction histidine kinase